MLGFAVPLCAAELDTIGITLLRQVDPTLRGTGIRVAQVEAPLSTNTPPPFEVTPAGVGHPASLFTWISSIGSASEYPNSVGAGSSHATSVGGNFYGTSAGAAPQVAHVDNYEANHFFQSVITPGIAIQPRIVNQSFIFHVADENVVNPAYDTYAAQRNTLFVSGIGNGNVPVSPSGTSFNSIGVGVFPGSSSAGPTSDGRSKPDITSPGSSATSFSTPYVSGIAAILLQAANRGDGGVNTNAAGDIRTLKALLLNGAIKPAGWTNGANRPLDARYGAGVVNAFNSWKQLTGGQRAFMESTTHGNSSAHPPGTNTNNLPVLSGWDLNSIATTPPTNDRVNHYYFNLTGSNAYTLTTTLVWNRQANQTSINDLNLFLYNTANSNLIACSTSVVDNVEHLFIPQLPPGRYDLQVWKKGSLLPSAAETYALAFEFFNLPLDIAVTNSTAVISWPLYPAGFFLQSATNLTQPVWTTVSAPASVNTNTSRNVVSVSLTEAHQFFRLQRP